MVFVDYPGHLRAGVLAATAAVLMIWAYRSEATRNIKVWPMLLCLLQLLAVLVLLLIIWNPSWGQITQKSSKNTVLVFFDTSRSMSVIEQDDKTRLDRAIEAYRQKIISAGKDKPVFKIYGFDKDCYPCGSAGSLGRWGTQTNMHKVVRMWANYDYDALDYGQQGQSKVVGAILFSDGQANNKNVNTYPGPLHNKFDVMLVGVGSTEAQNDIAVTSLKMPSKVALDTAFTAQAKFKVQGKWDQRVTIELLKDDYVIETRESSIGELRQNDKINFKIGAESLGWHCITVRAQLKDDEFNVANNIQRAMLEVLEEAKTKVLLYTHVINFDIGKVRQALARDKKVQLDVGIDAIIAPALSNKAREMSGHVDLPQSKEDFYKYDLIVLGPCLFDELTTEQIDGLYSFVVDRGGGIILLPGRDVFALSRCQDPKIKALLPIRFTSARGFSFEGQNEPIQLTYEGLDSKIVKQALLRSSAAMGRAFYGDMQKKLAASTLATANDKPILSVHRIGRGRVCLVNVYGLHRWYRSDRTGGLLSKLMGGLTSYLATISQLEAPVELFARRAAPAQQRIMLDAYVYDNQFDLVDDAAVLVEVGDKVYHMDQTEKGHYVCSVENIKEQVVLARARAQKDGTFLGEKSITVDLPALRDEMAQIELDERFLSALADKLKAKYIALEELDEDAANMFEPVSQIKTQGAMKSIWPNWKLLTGLCVLLSTIWFIKRTVGLA